MGGPLSALVAEVYLNFLENEILKSASEARFVHTWARYVDDVLCIWTGNTHNLQGLLQSLNTFDPAMKFTMELGGSSINYLDLRISLVESQNVLTPKFGIL